MKIIKQQKLPEHHPRMKNRNPNNVLIHRRLWSWNERGDQSLPATDIIATTTTKGNVYANAHMNTYKYLPYNWRWNDINKNVMLDCWQALREISNRKWILNFITNEFVILMWHSVAITKSNYTTQHNNNKKTKQNEEYFI